MADEKLNLGPDEVNAAEPECRRTGHRGQPARGPLPRSLSRRSPAWTIPLPGRAPR